jgi:hypothetical protein
VRGFSSRTLLYWIFTLSIASLLFQGCTRSVLQTYPASEHEFQVTASAFAKYRKIYQDECGCCLDAEVDVTASVSAGWFSNHSGKISGYLQAMEPGYIKFVVPNPLGQPIFIFLTNGEFFKALNVSDGKAYLGPVNAEAFKKFAPPGFDPGFSYYWLTGRLPPGDVDILKISRDKEQNGYWLQVRYENSGIESMVLFDPQESVVLRHIIINEKGHDEVDVVYGDYQPGYGREKKIGESGTEKNDRAESREYLCRIPTKISISSNSGADKKIDLKLFSFMPDAELSQDDFELEIPDNLEKKTVN